jgi:hypothetical protein
LIIKNSAVLNIPKKETKMLKYKLFILLLWLFCLSFIAPGQNGTSKYIDRSKKQAKINGCQLFPANNIWNTPIDNLPVDANSQQYINTIGANNTVHADFGSGLWDGGPIGIPYTTVPGSQEKVNVTFYYDDESDPGPYPVPSDAPIEGGSSSDGDRHVLIVDRDNCILYELYDAWPHPDGSWEAGSGAIYDLKSNSLRPDGWTSADAAGLPILPGLVRYDEVAAGEINHAIRFTAPQTRRKYIWPARHYASSLTGTQYPPMGQRFRLKAGFDISGFSARNQVILKALKKYGMILADNGSSWFISGTPDSRWYNDDLHQLSNIKGSDFEAVDESSLMINPNSGAALQGGIKNTITVISPNGGEKWTVGTTQNVTWSFTGKVSNVKIEYSTNNGIGWSTMVLSTPNDGIFSWTVPAVSSSNCKVRISETDGAPSDTSDSVFSIVSQSRAPKIFLNRSHLNASTAISGASTGPQTFWISNSGTGSLNWEISDNANWLTTNPSSGIDSSIVKVFINSAGLSPGSYNGTITVSDPNASNSPQYVTVYLTVKNSSQELPPFGSFDSPVHGSTVRSSIAVTGWALDDIEVEIVKIYRQGEGNLVYIGDAVFVEGARPDVETAYPDYPYNYKAGWGYMMLTNFLPNNGNGTYTLYAVATDISGNEVTLGMKTITCDNTNAVKPFGAIDTPTQGGEASGGSFINWGWVLTPQPNRIPTSGSTIDVYIDGVKLGQPAYNIYRADIASLFPGYVNSNGAAGYFFLDTTAYNDGVHTIQWVATDNSGNTDGIGSRYFTIQNSINSYKAIKRGQGGLPPCLNLPPFSKLSFPPDKNLPGDYPPGDSPIRVIKGYNISVHPQTIYADEDENITIEIKELERVEIHFSEGKRGFAPLLKWTGYQEENRQLRQLPIGSTLDRKNGIFYWQPGPGFIGEYQFIFFAGENRVMPTVTNLTIRIIPE